MTRSIPQPPENVAIPHPNGSTVRLIRLVMSGSDRPLSYDEEIMLAQYREIERLTALSQPMGVAGIPEGWKLVPIEPTEAMCEMALWASLNDETGREIVMKAIEAAPRPPAGQQDRGEAQAGWQPIETAPVATSILVVWRPVDHVDRPFHKEIAIGSRNYDPQTSKADGRFFSNGRYYDEATHVTHWMPLPSIPSIGPSTQGVDHG